MPSPFESLSMVALEAWALGKPVLANGACDVLRGQTLRSNGGLTYDTFDEVSPQRAVPWTKPVDIDFEAADLKQALDSI